MPLLSRTVLWAALATGVALPRWLYLIAQWSEAPSLRTLAWAGDFICLVMAALALFRLQRDVGTEESRFGMLLALFGYALDAVTTFAVPWMETPDVVIIVAVVSWTYGTSRWLADRCRAHGAPYFLFQLAMAAIVVSTVIARLRPEWPAFPTTLIIDTGMAVQCLLLARAIGEGDGDGDGDAR